jgi:FtsP/CotA-like multicopper oxidase with cupredoxin domain
MKRLKQPSTISTSRRSVLKISAATMGASLIPTRHAAAQTVEPLSADLPPSPPTQPFMEALPIRQPKQPMSSLSPEPQIARGAGEAGRADHQRWAEFTPRKFYEMRVKEGHHSYHPHLPTQAIRGYDSIYPGPTIHARYGEPILVRIYNDLSPDSPGPGLPHISTHMHNLHNSSESDGFPTDWYNIAEHGSGVTAPGAYRDHRYPNCYAGYDQYPATNGDPREALGTLWYHDHADETTGSNVYSGMAGIYLLFDEIDSGDENDTNPKALRLPSGEYDVPLLIQDLHFDSGGYRYFDPFEPNGNLGDKYCVNGKIQPYFKVARRKYRFRILNGSVARVYQFCVVNKGVNQSFSAIANDGNLLPAPLSMKAVQLAPAERADIVIDFSLYPIGSQLFLVNRYEQKDGRGPTGDLLTPPDRLLRFDVDREPPQPDVSRVPSLLRALPPFSTTEAVRTRTFKFDRTNGQWSINGELFNGQIAKVKPKLGTAEIWVLENTSGGWWHPIHIHFEEGQIISRNGAKPTAFEAGRKDVYNLKPGDIVRVFMRFRDFVGKYPMHCHNLTHEDHAMMLRWDIVP